MKKYLKVCNVVLFENSLFIQISPELFGDKQKTRKKKNINQRNKLLKCDMKIRSVQIE